MLLNQEKVNGQETLNFQGRKVLEKLLSLGGFNAWRLSLSIGLNDRATHKQEMTTEKAHEIVDRHVWDILPFATITEGQGYYKHEDGHRVKEHTIIVYSDVFFEDIDTTAPAVENLAKVLARELNQESIAYNRHVTFLDFIEADNIEE